MKRHYLLGTSGHVDHGKTTLIKALTGIDTDRLPEEKKRGLTIDLGFAYMELPKAGLVSIIDVPGHEKFLKNMLAGVGGYDLFLLVVDAREGVKPQTVEHLDIIELLEIKKGVVAITKTDTVSEDEIEIATELIKDLFQNRPFENVPILPVSAYANTGLTELKDKIEELILTLPPKDLTLPFRIPIDRVFVKEGFGIVVTGTLTDGTIKKNQAVEIYPDKYSSRIRQIHVHGKTVEEASASQRVALNLVSVEKDLLKRGQVILSSGQGQITSLINVNLKILANSPYPVKTGSFYKLYLGTSEIICKSVVLGKSSLENGETGVVQLQLFQPTTTFKDDRVIIRSLSPPATLGGGVIIDPLANRYKKKDEKGMAIISLAKENKDLVLLKELIGQQTDGILLDEIKTLALRFSFDLSYLEELEKSKEVIYLPAKKKYFLAENFAKIKEKITEALTKLEKETPWRLGFSRQEIIKNIKEYSLEVIEPFLKLMAEEKSINFKDTFYSTLGYTPQLTAKQENLYRDFYTVMEKAGFNSPDEETLQMLLRVDPQTFTQMRSILIERGILINLDSKIFFLSLTLDKGKEKIKEFIQQKGAITPSEAKDLLGTSRKYIIPILEYLDRTKFTIRQGNNRILARSEKN